MPLAGHLVFLPNQGQRPRKQDRNQKQHADHGERQPDVVLVIEQNPCRKSEPGDEADRGLIDGWVKLIKNRPVVSSLFMMLPPIEDGASRASLITKKPTAC